MISNWILRAVMFPGIRITVVFLVIRVSYAALSVHGWMISLRKRLVKFEEAD